MKQNYIEKDYLIFIYFFVSLFYWKKIMKDIIKRVLVSIIFGVLLWYIIFLITQWAIVVSWEYLNSNTLVYGVLIVFCLFMFIMFGIYPIHFKMTKATLFVIWAAWLLLWEYILINNVSESVYISDIIKLVSVILLVLSPTNVLITNKIQKKSKEGKMEVIEV